MISVEIFHDFGWFFATRIRFIEADLDPADLNETDPYGSGSETLVKMYCKFTAAGEVNLPCNYKHLLQANTTIWFEFSFFYQVIVYFSGSDQGADRGVWHSSITRGEPNI